MWSGGRIASCRAFAAVPLGAGGAVPRYVSSAWQGEMGVTLLVLEQLKILSKAVMLLMAMLVMQMIAMMKMIKNTQEGLRFVTI